MNVRGRGDLRLDEADGDVLEERGKGTPFGFAVEWHREHERGYEITSRWLRRCATNGNKHKRDQI